MNKISADCVKGLYIGDIRIFWIQKHNLLKKKFIKRMGIYKLFKVSLQGI